MKNKIKSERFRKLSIAALVMGILTYSYIYLIPQVIMSTVFALREHIQNEAIIASIVGIIVFILLGLPIAAVVCGSIDLKRIKRGLCSVKGRGLDITGIVLGSIFLLGVLMFLIGEFTVPH